MVLAARLLRVRRGAGVGGLGFDDLEVLAVDAVAVAAGAAVVAVAIDSPPSNSASLVSIADNASCIWRRALKCASHVAEESPAVG